MGVDGGDVELFYTLWANSANQEYYETQPGACQTTSIRFGYAGYVRDASVNNGSDTTTFGERNYTGAMAGLYHVRHRAYDPELGRWTRRDPIGYVDGLNIYEMVGSDPINGGDPSGLGCTSWKPRLVSAPPTVGGGIYDRATAETENSLLGTRAHLVASLGATASSSKLTFRVNSTATYRARNRT